MRFWWHIVKAMWKHLNGRWYVWRDTPDDVLRDVLKIDITHEEDSEVITLVRGAWQEHKLREARLGR